MNASNAADAACNISPTPAEAGLQTDQRNIEESLPAESEFLRLLATLLVFLSWVYLILKSFLDHDANRAEMLNNELRNELEGDYRLHEMFDNANDFDLDPVDVAAAAVYQPPGQQALATETSSSPNIVHDQSAASPLTRQAAPPTERRRRQRSNDVTVLGTVDPDEALPDAAAADSARAAESVQGKPEIDGVGKPKNPLKNVRKYAPRVQKPEDSRSREPETSDEDFVPPPLFNFKPETETLAPPDDRQTTQTTAIVIATLIETQQLANNSETTVVDDCNEDTQATARDVPSIQPPTVLDVPAVHPLTALDVPSVQPPDYAEDFQVPPINLQLLENDADPSPGSNSDRHRLKRIAVFNRHGTSFDEDLIPEAAAKTEWNSLGAENLDDNANARTVTQLPGCHRIIDCMNARLLEQLAEDLVRRMEEQRISDERLWQEVELQTRARVEAQRCYAEVVEQVRSLGLGLECARYRTPKVEEDHRPNRESTDRGKVEDTTPDDVNKPEDAMP